MVTVSQLSAKAYSGCLNFNKSRAVIKTPPFLVLLLPRRELGLKKRTKNKKEIFEKGKGKAREKQYILRMSRKCWQVPVEHCFSPIHPSLKTKY
jgi:hypothetical protein